MSYAETTYDFDLFARYYDLDQGDISEDISFFLSLAQRYGSPILEMGCGTGRLLLPLAQGGYQVTGVDIAPAMLAMARGKTDAAGLQDRISLVESDVCSVRLPGRFPLAICALNTLMHLPSLESQYALLQSAYRHLTAGGLFVADVLNPYTSALSDVRTPLLLEKEMIDPQTGHRVLKLFSQRVDLARQISDITLIYDEIDGHGHVHRTLVPTRMRWLYPYEGRLLFEAAGFRVEQMYGSYELEPFQTESERLILIGRVR